MNFNWGFNWRFGLSVGISIYIYNLIIEKYWPDLHKLYKAIFVNYFYHFAPIGVILIIMGLWTFFTKRDIKE